MARKIGPRAIALLHHFEACSLESYLCPAGKWTIGWGNTFYEDGRPVRGGERITQERADALFLRVLEKFEAGVEQRAKGGGTDEQFGAMVSLAYNIGLGNFGKSSVLRRHNAGDYPGAATAFLLWNKSGGKVMRGLTRRRQAEKALYEGKLFLVDKLIGYKG